MKREWTNIIRHLMDEWIPPIIRDSRWFMRPFYMLAYKKRDVSSLMDFKSRAYSMTPSDYADFYANLGNSISRSRISDLNQPCLNYIQSAILDTQSCSLLDVGSGNGYLLNSVKNLRSWERISGVDVAPPTKTPACGFEQHTGALPNLPFKNNEFDVVTCTHVIEHVVDVPAAALELIRIARKRILIVVPRQRYYYYTLDEHLNFYPSIQPLAMLFSQYSTKTMLLGGDWVLDVSKDL